jgi:hypothetical protein
MEATAGATSAAGEGASLLVVTRHGGKLAGMANENALDPTHWTWSKFDELNARHFGAKLVRPQAILRSSMGHRDAQSVETTVDGKRVSMIWIDGAVLDADREAASDSLLHEMIHQELAVNDGDPDLDHADRFVTRADEIGRSLGLRPCRTPQWSATQIQQVATVWPKVQREAAKLSPAQGGPRRSEVGRNDLCPCGSGKKFKRCCLNGSTGQEQR